MIRKFVGAVAAALALMAGLWLMIAPFALGTQPESGDWIGATRSEFFTGLGVAVLGVVGVAAFVASIHEELVARGLVTVRERRPRPEPRPAPEPAPVAPQSSSAELATLLAPLVEALREDLNRTGEHRQNGTTTLVGAEDDR
ncbi:hypothetical protein [Nonomuraea cavernae]|uniref:Uncharacterized protein n=1 Tax=Nonomuraea cavernae TaxID=2045107 RepID=A0A918DQU3_9ACTN|nr:hypothetical protein [Nonomuraea cavernae]MCA2189905.1 hypothetical protein [Nonomuraea cavernae]GGO77845.1 hypothetical protein GCM10012289_58460 [Nonomuraea cavernae]